MRRWPARRTTLANRLQFDVEAFAANAENFYAVVADRSHRAAGRFMSVGVYRGTWDHFKRKDRMTFLKGVALGAGDRRSWRCWRCTGITATRSASS